MPLNITSESDNTHIVLGEGIIMVFAIGETDCSTISLNTSVSGVYVNAVVFIVGPLESDGLAYACNLVRVVLGLRFWDEPWIV